MSKIAVEVVLLVKSHCHMNQPRQLQTQRDVLHVQCMSYWAPMCIGPYSQANTIYDSLIFVAGQIPLNPATMTLWDQPMSPSLDTLSLRSHSLIYQLILCLRHVHRILTCVKGSLCDGISCIVYVNSSIFMQLQHVTFHVSLTLSKGRCS